VPGRSRCDRNPSRNGVLSAGRQLIYFGPRGGALAFLDGRLKNGRLSQQEEGQMAQGCKNVPTLWRDGPPG
jgi:hypothetical protein